MKPGSVASLALGVAFLSGFSLSNSLASEIEHFGAPPRGYVKLSLKGESPIAPAQFVGTLNPPVIMMNGQRLKTEPVAEHLQDSQGIWFNGQKKQTSDRLGRFFFELNGAELAVPSIDIVLRNREGKVFRAVVKQEHFFLEAPEAPPVVLEENQIANGKYPFTFSGALPEGSILKVEDGSVSQDAQDKATVRVSLPIGRSVLIARLEGKDRSSQIFNIPVVVSETRATQKDAVLSVEVPGDNAVGRPWILPYYGAKLKGLSNTGGKLQIDGEPASLDSEGRFSVEINSKGPEWESEFLVTPPGEETTTFKKEMLCPKCVEAGHFFTPPYKKMGDLYLFSPIVHSLFYFAEGGLATGTPAPGTGVGAGIYLHRHFHLEAQAEHWFKISGGNMSPYSSSSTTYIGAALSYVPFPIFFFGIDLGYAITTVHYSQSMSSLGGPGDYPSNSPIGGFHLGFRFKLSDKLELTPRMTAMPKPYGAKAFNGFATIDPVALRYNL